MSACTHALVTLTMLLGVAEAVAEGGRPLREADSANKRFHLQIRPGRPGTDAVRGCRATLYERSAERHRGRPRWGRFLVNDVSPAVALVRDDGRFVVTLGEYGVGGARNALVIYGEQGELLRHFLLPDLLEPGDWKHVKVRTRSIEWREGAKYRFVDEPPQFVITLQEEREIRIDLRTMQVVRAGASLAGVTKIPAEFLLLLYGEQVATSIAEVTKAAEAKEVVASEPETVTESVEAEVEPDVEAAAKEEVLADATVDESAGGIVIPRPDPAEPFDYLAWMNEMTLTEGPSAAEDYQTAMDRLVPWEGDRALLQAAGRGDADALASPEVRRWLADNGEALAYFRSAPELEYNGWRLESEDGRLISAVLPQLQPIRELGRAAVMEGRMFAAEGQFEAAADAYLDVLAVGAQASYGVTVIETLVGMAVQAPAADALLDLQAQDAGFEIDYAHLAGQLGEAYQPTRSLRETLQLERAMFMDTVQGIYAYDADAGDYVLNEARAAEILGLAPLLNDIDPLDRHADVARQREVSFEQVLAEGEAFHDALTEAMSLPYAEAYAQLDAIAQAAQADPELSPVTRAMAPNFARAYFIETRAETMRRAAQLSVNLRAYRQQHGAYPESLDALGVREIATDPFTGAAFRYERGGDDFVLYSVGANGSDDGGLHDPKAASNDYVLLAATGKIAARRYTRCTAIW